MRYARNLDHLVLLIRFLEAHRGEKEDYSVEDLALKLDLEAPRVADVLRGHPALFRRSLGAVPGGAAASWWRRLVRMIGLSGSSIEIVRDDAARYALQPWGMNGAAGDHMADFVERRAAEERAQRRTLLGVALGALAAILVAVVLSGAIGEAVARAPWQTTAAATVAKTEGDRVRPDRWPGEPGKVQASPPAEKPASVQPVLVCSACPAAPVTNAGPDEGRPLIDIDWTRLLALLVGLGALGAGVLAFVAPGKSGAARSLLSAGSVGGFLASAAAWAQPALVMKPDDALHNATATVLLFELAFAFLLLLSALLLGGKQWRWRWWWWWTIPPLIFLAALALGIGLAWESVLRDLVYPYCAADLPALTYASLLATCGLMGVLASAWVAHLVSGWRGQPGS